jgi:hypothetical protein
MVHFRVLKDLSFKVLNKFPKIQVQVFRAVTPCSVAVAYLRFGGPWCLHLQDEGPPKRWYPTATVHGVTARKISTSSLKTSNPVFMKGHHKIPQVGLQWNTRWHPQTLTLRTMAMFIIFSPKIWRSWKSNVYTKHFKTLNQNGASIILPHGSHTGVDDGELKGTDTMPQRQTHRKM